MFCTVTTLALLCVTVPKNDIREQLIYQRMNVPAIDIQQEGYVLQAIFTPEIPVPQPRPEYKVTKTKVKPPKTSNHVVTNTRSKPRRERIELSYTREEVNQPGFFAKLFGGLKTKSTTTLPKVKGVDLNKPGYAAVYAAAKKHGVDPNLALRMAKQESGGNCKARSHANARGVMQVIPSTARPHGVSASDLYNCKKGAEAGVKEIKSLLNRTNGDVRKMLVGYNCGVGCLKRTRLPKETKNYIRVIGGGKI